jgi:hypothetical protein
MENNFIKIDGEVYAVNDIRHIGQVHEHNESQLYFRISYKGCTATTDVEFHYADYLDDESETDWDEQVETLTNKLQKEMEKLQTYLLTGEGTKTKTYFQKIDLRKNDSKT